MDNKCKIDKCLGKRREKGYCDRHYWRYFEPEIYVYIKANKIFDDNINLLTNKI
jgi:hypothetical protein